MRRQILTLATLLALALSAPTLAQETKAAAPVTAPLKVEGKVPAVTPSTQPAAAPAAKAAEPAAAPVAVKVEQTTQQWWQALLSNLISAALAIFIPVLSALAFLLLRKIGIKVDLATLDSLAGKAALYAEKKASTALGEGKPKSTGAQKEEWAWDLVKSVDAKLGGSAKAREKLRGLILAKIPAAEAAVAAAKPPSNGAA